MSDATAANRWLLTGQLRTLSPMEIRTGATESPATLPAGIQPGVGEPQDDASPQILAIDLAADRLPVIPATALKGRLRAVLVEDFGDAEFPAIARLLGDRPERGRNSDAPDAQVSIGGAAEFRNARMVCPDGAVPQRPPVLGKTAIHHGTRTAAEGLLRHSRVVPEGTGFAFEIVADGLSDADIALLCHALRRLDGGHGSALGGRRRTGQGRIELTPGSLAVRRLDRAALAAWLADDAGRSWRDFAQTVDPAGLVAPAANPMAPGPAMSLTVAVEGLFLVTRAQPGTKQSPGAREPRIVRRDDGDHPLLPGETLNGALRAQAMRIWRTLANTPGPARDDNKAPAPVAELFGTTLRRGRLELSDFVGTAAAQTRGHEMVAIDRFHGGNSGSAKFNVTAFESPHLAGHLRLDVAARHNHRATGKESRADPSLGRALSREAFGLFVLLFRDLAEGDLAAGFGTRKGYGRLSMVGDWQEQLVQFAAALPWQSEEDASDPMTRGRARIAEAVAALHAAHAATTGRDPPRPPAAPAPQPAPAPAPASPPTAVDDSFLNAYHFVPVQDGVAPVGADGSLDIAHARSDDFGHTPETARDGHAIYLDGTWSGEVTCRIRALQPFIVGDRRHGGDAAAANRHESRYAVLQPFLRDGEPAISGTSLKGMVSSIIESVSRSALRVLDDLELTVAGIGRGAPRQSLGTVHALFGRQSRDLLPMSESRTLVTPAERMFGYVSSDAPPKGQEARRIRALAGRLRFADARLCQSAGPSLEPESDFAGETYEGETVGRGYHRLRELASPLKPVGKQPDRRNGTPALYFRQSATPADLLPQGRKFYLHHPPGRDPWLTDMTADEDHARQGSAGPAAPRKTATRLVARGQEFVFRVVFDNLSPHELGLLLFALRPSEAFCHKLGLGKPIGLGSVHLTPEALHIVDRLRRYAGDDTLAAARAVDRSTVIGQFIAAARAGIERDAPQALAALLAIGETHAFGGGRPAAGTVVPVPMTREQLAAFRSADRRASEQETFRWFQTNRGREVLAPIVADAAAARAVLRADGARLPMLRANGRAAAAPVVIAAPAAAAPAAVPAVAAPAPACGAGGQTGTVKWYNAGKGYGFIVPDSGGRDVFVHRSALEAAGIAGLPDGTGVAFAVERRNNGKLSAVNLRLL